MEVLLTSTKSIIEQAADEIEQNANKLLVILYGNLDFFPFLLVCKTLLC